MIRCRQRTLALHFVIAAFLLGAVFPAAHFDSLNVAAPRGICFEVVDGRVQVGLDPALWPGRFHEFGGIR